jgi:hypothetical protein
MKTGNRKTGNRSIKRTTRIYLHLENGEIHTIDIMDDKNFIRYYMKICTNLFDSPVKSYELKGETYQNI